MGLARYGEKCVCVWGGGYGGGGRGGILYLSLHFHHQNDSCIKMAAMRVSLMFH